MRILQHLDHVIARAEPEHFEGCFLSEGCRPRQACADDLHLLIPISP